MLMYQRASGAEMFSMYNRVSELQQKYDAPRAREQSLSNKILGAAAIGAAGIGGMQLFSGMAEQQADADAERDMRAYLATFRCEYAPGKQIKGGETGIELPGANDLAPMYAQYVALAADLKERKENMDMMPGIESEVIIDKAKSGMYDDVGVGITGGAYTSISRALKDPTGTDAAAWNAQKSDAKSKTKTGGITMGVGAIGGAAGNLIINRDADTDVSDDKK